MNNPDNTISIVIHGRGGQGAKTAAMLLAEVAISLGRYAQAFPEYGPERSGAPVKAYIRISDKAIRTHQPIINPDIVIIIDDSLLDFISVTDGIKPDSTIVINTNNSEVTKKKLKLPKGFFGKIAVVNATAIALERIGANKSNTATLAATLKVMDFIKFNEFQQEAKSILIHKLGKEKTDQNMLAIKDAFEEVKVI